MESIYENLIDLDYFFPEHKLMKSSQIVVSIGPGLLIDVPRGTNITGMFSTLFSVHIL